MESPLKAAVLEPRTDLLASFGVLLGVVEAAKIQTGLSDKSPFERVVDVDVHNETA